MAKFCELGVESDVVIGKGIDMEDLFGRRILIEKVIIQPTKFPGKNSSGLRMQMQVVLATFNEAADKDGDFFTKNPDGTPAGERRSCFTGSLLQFRDSQRDFRAVQQAPNDPGVFANSFQYHHNAPRFNRLNRMQDNHSD